MSKKKDRVGHALRTLGSLKRKRQAVGEHRHHHGITLGRLNYYNMA